MAKSMYRWNDHLSCKLSGVFADTSASFPSTVSPLFTISLSLSLSLSLSHGEGTQRPNFQFLFFTDSFGGFNEETNVENRLKNIEASQS